MRRIIVSLLIITLMGCAQFEEVAMAPPRPEPVVEIPLPSVPVVEEPVIVVPVPDPFDVNPLPVVPVLDTTKRSFWFWRNTRHTQPLLGIKPEYMEKYSLIALGSREEKRIYLTFDEGYEQGYTDHILDTLLEEKVPAVFFVTGLYVLSQPRLIRRMVAEGHVVGNHTVNHPSLPDLDEAALKAELEGLEALLEPLTGKKSRFLRPPMGHYSEFSLAVSHELGYRNVFWSMAYADWYVDNQPGADYAYEHVVSNIHNGAVILLHAVSESNSEALGRMIRELKAQGYEFRSLEDDFH